jgi:hypothetical protein
LQFVFEPKYILTVFNQHDTQANGLIDSDAAYSIMDTLNIKGAHIPIDRLFTFDDILSIISLA